MKKIVALVLSLVMVLGLATTAFGAITLWSPNGSTEKCDIYDGEYNVKELAGVDVEFHPAVALKLDKDGVAANVANVAYYTISLKGTLHTPEMAQYWETKYFVMVNSIPADAEAGDYILVKAADATVKVGDTMFNQSAADAYFIMKEVDYVFYTATGAEFSDWSDDCEKYADPELYDAVTKLPVPFYTVNNKTAGISNLFVKYAEVDVASVDYAVLVDGEVVVVGNPVQATTPHFWRASAWDALGNPTEFTCSNCKTVGTVINASINAPAGAKIDRVGNILIAYNMVKAPAAADTTETVESAKTFDAGIAMYVGMSVMAAAGSAVVLKKKD